MTQSRTHVKHRDTTLFRLRDYEPQKLGGTLTFPMLGKQVYLSKNVTTPGDHQDITPDRLAELAAAQGVTCRVTDWTEGQEQGRTGTDRAMAARAAAKAAALPPKEQLAQMIRPAQDEEEARVQAIRDAGLYQPPETEPDQESALPN